MSSIGFGVHTQEDFLRLAKIAAPDAETIVAGDLHYLRWTSDAGCELWIQQNAGNEIIGMVPHFTGAARMKVALTKRITRETDTPLDGAFLAWADPKTDNAETGEYPFVFDTPDYLVHTGVALPSAANVQLAAFAHELQIYKDEAEYEAEQVQEPKLAAESFIPSGMFRPDGGDIDPPQAMGIITGVAMEAGTRVNPITNATFHTARVRSLGGEFDIVADPEFAPDGIAKGNVVSGSFWLSGRIL